MRKSRFSEDQIIGVLREQEAGAATADVCASTASADDEPTTTPRGRIRPTEG